MSETTGLINESDLSPAETNLKVVESQLSAIISQQQYFERRKDRQNTSISIL